MRKLSLQELARLTPEEYASSKKIPLLLVLDNIRSALNVGSFFRTADAFALEEILLVGMTATPPHKEITKTAIGAQDTVEWQAFEKAEGAIAYLKERQAATLILEQTDSSMSLEKLNWLPSTPLALVVGNEVGGVSDEWLEQCTLAIEIDQYGTKHSLNVAVAGGMAIWKIQSLLRTS